MAPSNGDIDYVDAEEIDISIHMGNPVGSNQVATAFKKETFSE